MKRKINSRHFCAFPVKKQVDLETWWNCFLLLLEQPLQMCLQQEQGTYTIVTICGGCVGKVEPKYILPSLLLKRNNANTGQHLYKFPRIAMLHQNLLSVQLSHRSRASDQGIFLCEELQPWPLPGCIVQLPVGSTSVPINTPLTY